MRNLKRVLSLALALVMVLGMMVIGTSAATFTDAEEITYTEAVEVLSELGILIGDNGKFNPAGKLNRAGAAKLIAFMTMGADADEYLAGSASVFTDVPADHWAAKYVAYCSNLKIINGNGDGTFNPNGNISTVGFTKLVLGAAGVAGTYTGDGWEQNVKDAAEKAGLDVITIDNTDITREEAAALMLAGLKYTGDAEIYGVYNSSDVLVKTYAEAIDAYFAAAALGTGFYVEILPAETYLMNSVFGVLYNDVDAVDSFGRPGIEYYDRKTGGYVTYLFFADDAVATYVNKFNKDIVDAMTEANNDVDPFASATILYNGYTSVGADTIAELYSGKIALNGVTVELYNLDTNVKTIEKVIVTEKNFATVTDVTLTEGTTAGSVTIAMAAWDDARSITYTDNLKSSYDAYDFLCGYAEDTALLVIVDQNTDALKFFEEPTAVTGKITKMNVASSTNGSTVSIDGVEYKMNQMFVAGKTLATGSEGTLYVDELGYAMGWVGKANPKPQYAYVLAMDSEQDNGLFGTGAYTWYAQLLYADGTVEVVKTSESSNAKEGYLVSYAAGTGANAGKIVLTSIASTYDPAGTMALKGNTASQIGGIFNNKTIVVVETAHPTIPNKMVYTVYTGVTNIPNMVADKFAGVKAPNSDNYSVFYALGATLDTTPNTAKNVVYLGTSSTLVKEVISATKTLCYYTVPAIVNGEITTVKVAAGNAPTYTIAVGTGLYDALTYDADGLVISATAKQDNNTTKVAVLSKTGTAKAADGVIALGGTSYVYDDATVVYKVANGAISVSSIGALKADNNDTVVGFTTNGVLTMIVVTTVANQQQ